jgi:hypothetical protein
MSRKIALHRVDIPLPCTASWEKMTGNARVRHCGECNKNVYNLSAMREAEATALLESHGEGEVCVRFYRRQDGTVLTSDCGGGNLPAPVPKAWGKLPGLGGMALAALAATGCAPRVVPPPPDNVVFASIVEPAGYTMGVPEVQVASLPQEPQILMGAPVVRAAVVEALPEPTPPPPVEAVLPMEPPTQEPAEAPPEQPSI